MSIIADDIRRKQRERIPEVFQFPKDLGAHSMLLVFNKYEYKKPGTRQLNKVTTGTYSSQNLANTQSVLLPLPKNIQDNFSVRVQRFDQEGITGETLSGLGNAMQSEGDVSLTSIYNTLSSSLGINRDTIRDMSYGDMARNAAFLGRRTIDEVLPGASRNLDVGFGNTINPKAALYFEGVELKTHSFNWVLAPTSSDESETIKNIGNTIKRNILPSYGNFAGSNASRLLLNYPSVLDIYFLGIDQSYFIYYKSCMVTQFNIDFSPNGLAFVKGGKPAIVNMDMNVMETDIHTSEDYNGASTNYDTFVGTGGFND